jgi:glycine C-acetyltransferase
MKMMPDIIMGSFSKAFGSFGGWIGCSSEVADYLRYYAKTIIFSVGLPAMSAACSLAALEHIRDDSKFMCRLSMNMDHFKTGLKNLGFVDAGKSKSAIVSIVIGDEGLLKEKNRELFKAGVWAEGLPYPAVPKGSERLRFRVSARHTTDDLDFALNVIDTVLDKSSIPRQAATSSRQNQNSEEDYETPWI